MKNLILVLLGLVMAVNVGTSQDYKKLLKKASKNLGKYNLDPVNNTDKLTEALAQIDEAFSSDEAKIAGKAWLTKGQIFNELANADISKKFLSPTPISLSHPDASLTAYDALAKAIELFEKKGDKKKAYKALIETEGHLHNTGIFMYQDQKFAEAFANFDAETKTYEILSASKNKSRLDDPAFLQDHIFTTAVSAYYAKNYEGASPYLKQVYDGGSSEPFVYEALYNINAGTDEAAAIKYLEEGRAAFPEDQGIMFAEINHYLKKGEIESLVAKLEKAAEMEPENMSVAVTLGSVYDQLSVKSSEAGNKEKAEEYFNNAKSTYAAVIAKDPKNFDATYSTGALFYNKAASMTEALNALADDYSKAGTAKYNALKKDMDALFLEALPHFLAAEAINPKDPNTLIALKEIYARDNQLEKSAEYKTKYEALGNE